MFVRLGQFLYWLGCGLAVLVGGLGTIPVLRSDAAPGLGLFVYLGISLLIWLLGRAALHFLAASEKPRPQHPRRLK